MTFEPRQLMRHVEKLCDLSPRLTGTPSEAAAADYTAAVLERVGAEVTRQVFPITRWECRDVAVEVRRGHQWHSLRALPIGHSPSTRGVVEGDMVVVEHLTADNPALRACADKIAVVLGMWGEDAANLDSLARAKPAAAVFLDNRLPSYEPVQDSLPMGWVDKLRVPAVTIPYFEGWDLVRQPGRLRVRVDCLVEKGESQNVIARLVGSHPGAGGILLSAHHDSVAIGRAADDDATGVACVLELARALASVPRRRDVWAVTFGCEEHLSVGAEAFVREEAHQAHRLATVINFDSCGSLLGRTQALVTGEPALQRWVHRQIARLGEQVVVEADVSPYSDHFFFTAAGVPAVWFYRTNFVGGRWYHHQALDCEEVVGPEALASVARTGFALARELVRSERLPYPRRIPDAQLERIRHLERTMATWPPR